MFEPLFPLRRQVAELVIPRQWSREEGELWSRLRGELRILREEPNRGQVPRGSRERGEQQESSGEKAVLHVGCRIKIMHTPVNS